MENITIQDYLDRSENGEATIINDGQVIGFEKENDALPTAK